jgi:prophage regulatory protein
MTDRFLRLADVVQTTGLSRSTIYDYMAVGKFPKPVPLGQQARGWVESEIGQWKRERLAAREAQAA